MAEPPDERAADDVADAGDAADALRTGFAATFEGAGAELPADARLGVGERGSFQHGEWSFRYVVNECDGAPCLDVVAQIDGEDQLERILANGDVESGPYFSSMVILDPDVDEDLDAAERRVAAENDRVAAVMRERGLL